MKRPVWLKIKMPCGIVLLVRKRVCPGCGKRWSPFGMIAGNHYDGCPLTVKGTLWLLVIPARRK